MPARRIVFLDIDGTIVDHDQRLAPRAAEAVHRARAAGHLVYLCTGRGRASILPQVTDIGFDGVISVGGGFIEQGGRLVLARPMSAPDAHRIVDFFTANDIEYTLQTFDGIYPSDGLAARLAPRLDRMPRPGEDDVPEDRAARLRRTFVPQGMPPMDAVAKATFVGRDLDAYRLVRDGLGPRFHTITGSIPYLDEAGGEVSLQGMNKGTAIEELLRLLQMPRAASLAIGDSANDREMLQTVGVGIAMGQAPADVRAAADETTAAVDDDGVWHAFVRHGLV